MALLSVIIPFGLSKERPYIEERVIEKAKYFKSDENIEFILLKDIHLKITSLKILSKQTIIFILKIWSKKLFLKENAEI